MVGMHAHLKGGLLRTLLRTPRPRARGAASAERAPELLEFVGLGRRVDEQRSRNLPYGDQRRLEVARALAPSRRCCCSTSRPPA